MHERIHACSLIKSSGQWVHRPRKWQCTQLGTQCKVTLENCREIFSNKPNHKVVKCYLGHLEQNFWGICQLHVQKKSLWAIMCHMEFYTDFNSNFVNNSSW